MYHLLVESTKYRTMHDTRKWEKRIKLRPHAYVKANHMQIRTKQETNTQSCE